MRSQQLIAASLLARLAQAILPEPLLLALLGRRLTPVRVESNHAAQLRRLADRCRRD